MCAVSDKLQAQKKRLVGDEVELLHQPRLVSSGIIGMDDALLSGLIQSLEGSNNGGTSVLLVLQCNSFLGSCDGRLYGGEDRLVLRPLSRRHTYHLQRRFGIGQGIHLLERQVAFDLF